jgi:hypothetical protein
MGLAGSRRRMAWEMLWVGVGAGVLDLKMKAREVRAAAQMRV